MDELTSTTGIIALAAGALALLALSLAAVLAARVHRLRRDQRAVLGDENRDLVAHAAGLGRDFAALHKYVEDVAERLHDRMATTEERLKGAIAYRAVVRYDAYGEMSGRQSTTVALLDAERSGLVLSSILHRDQARLYAKQIHGGEAEQQLSPEEEEAVRLALQAGPVGAPD